MSDMRPSGIAVTVGGVERHVLFTLAAVDEIQSKWNLPVSEVIAKMSDEMEVYPAMLSIISALINDEIARNNLGDPVTEEELKRQITVPECDGIIAAILMAYGVSVPEKDEDEDPHLTRSRKS